MISKGHHMGMCHTPAQDRRCPALEKAEEGSFITEIYISDMIDDGG